MLFLLPARAINLCQWLSVVQLGSALGISLAVGRLTLDQLALVRIQDPQPSLGFLYVLWEADL